MSLPGRIIRSLRGRLDSLREHPLRNPLLAAEIRREAQGGHPADPESLPHLTEAVDWLERAQDGTPDDGIARGYSLGYLRYFRSRGWQASYPETTGYIIPTLLEAARRLDRPALADRARRAGEWEIAVQLPDGAVQGGVIGEGRSPAVFNTGQVMFGWLALFEESDEPRFAEAARRAGRYLVSVQQPDGHWSTGNSEFARKDTTLYNARVAWALAEAGVRLDQPEFTAGAARNLRAVAARQQANGWFPHCCLSDPARPLLHTLAYTIRGLVEGGRVLHDDALLEAAILPARAILELVREDGWLPGRFNPDWSGAVEWSCLTGNAQMVNNWIRLWAITGDRDWLGPAGRVLDFLKRTQNRESRDPGLRGGIKGSFPVTGGYGRHEVLNWATKYFADALMRERDAAAGARRMADGYRLA